MLKVSYSKYGCEAVIFFTTQNEFIEWIHNNEKLGMMDKELVITKMESIDYIPTNNMIQTDDELPPEIRKLLEPNDSCFIPENMDEYMNSHKEILAFDFYDHRCEDRIVLYFESEEDLEKWIGAYPFHRACIYVYHKEWVSYTGQAITIPPDTVVADTDKIIRGPGPGPTSKLTPEECRDEWERAEGVGKYRK